MEETKKVALSNSEVAKERKTAMQTCVCTDVNGDVCQGEYCELSVYSSIPAMHSQIVEECAPLLVLFPDMSNSAFLLLHHYVEDAGMSAERLHEAVNNLVKHNKYRTFSAAEILSYDKTIIAARTVSALRYATKNPQLSYDDIAIFRTMLDGNECKMYGVRYDVENSPYKSKIIGLWDGKANWWRILGQVKDNTIEQRKQDFKRALYRYCNNPPKYKGKYATMVVKGFYEYFSQVMDFGDILRFEQCRDFDIESALKRWNERYTNEPSMNSEKAQSAEEPNEEDIVRNKIAVQVIKENIDVYGRLPPQFAQERIERLINARINEQKLQLKSN